MPYNSTQTLLFIHIPKTAGTSIIKMFNMDEKEGHISCNQYEESNKILYDNAYKFAIVRNPWDKFVSCYEYAKMKKSYWHSINGDSIYGKHIDYDLVTKYDNFNDFIKYLSDIEEPILPLKSVNWTYQYQWICDNKFNIKIDTVYRYEHLNYMIKDLNNKFNYNLELPHINKSKDKDYKTYYNDNSIHFVNKIYKKDIDLFNYKFK